MTEIALRAWIAGVACFVLAACVSSANRPVDFGSTEKAAPSRPGNTP